MKKYLFLILLFLIPLLGQSAEFKIDETKSDIYFANSILTTEEDAKINLDLILEKTLEEQYNNDIAKMEKELNFDIAYNQTTGFQGDIYETIMQLSDEDLTWEMLIKLISYATTRGTGKFITKLPKEQKELFEKIFDATKNMYKSFTQIQHDIDLSKQVQSYQNSIRQGHRVIVIAHGQGDLFTNEASKKMLEPDTLDGVTYRDNDWLKDYFSWISVGTPSSERLLPHIVVSFHNDKLASFSVLQKLENPNKYQTQLATGELSDLLTWDFHKFEYYMGKPVHIKDDIKDTNVATDIAKTIIMDFIKNSIQEHKTAESQWIVDQQLNFGTKDYRIAVKHYKDSSLNQYLQNKEIYPFAPLKKLYHVADPNDPQNNFVYVKASFGGEEILDTWENQKDHQFYFLEGTNPAEYIEGEALDLSKGLVAHFEFEDNANDSSGNANHGIEYGNIDYIDGMLGKAASLNGYGDYIRTNVLLDKDSDTFTISLWLENFGTGGMIFMQYPNGSYYHNHTFAFLGDNTLAHDEFIPASGNLQTDEPVGNGFNLLTTTRDGLNRRIYINGVLVAEDNNAETYAGSSPTYSLIGARLYNNKLYPNNTTLNATIDDLRIYDRALSEAEIQRLYDLGK